ncbi:hypothetical protein Bbelb_307530 [Branchiostoma belcheri]|nr:hypothetical protein Bbelb_307530 [Branchiostoma belcheri]
MATPQLSRLAKLFLMISDNLIEDDVRNLKALLSIDKILGRAKVEKATPLEIFDMLVENKTIGKGNLGFLVQVLRSLGKETLAEEAARLEQEQQIEESEPRNMTYPGDQEDSTSDDSDPEYRTPVSITPDDSESEYTTPEDSGPEDSASDDDEPEHSTPKSDNPEDIGPEDSTPKPKRQEDIGPEDSTPKPKRQEDIGQEDSTPKPKRQEDIGQEDSTPKPKRQEDIGQEDSTPKPKRQEDIGPEDSTPKLKRQEDVGPEDSTSKPKSYEDSGPADSGPADSASDDSTPKPDRPEDSGPEDSGPEDNTLKSDRPEDSEPEDSTPKPKSPEDSGPDDSTPKPDSPADGPEDSTPKPDSPADGPEDSTPKPDSPADGPEDSTPKPDSPADSGPEDSTPNSEGQEDSASEDSGPEDITPKPSTPFKGGPEDTEVKEVSASPDNEETTEEFDDTGIENVASELASLHIKELIRLMTEPKRTPQSGSHSATAAAVGDKVRQFDICCQIGDLYRTKLHSLQSALQHYQNMLDCSKSLTENTKQAKAHNRLGLTYDSLGKQQEAIRCHEKTLEIYKSTANNETELCVAYKNLASSLSLSDQGSNAKPNYESALAVAMETGNKTEQMDIYCKLGDLHILKLHEKRVLHKYYTEVLALARDLGRRDMEKEASNRLGLAYYEMGEYESALEWFQKYLDLSQDDGDTKYQAEAHTCLGDTYRFLGKLDQAKFHFDTAVQLAQQTGDQYAQMKVYFSMGDLQREQLHSPRTAIQYYEQHLALARQLGDSRWEGRAYNRLGWTQYAMGEYEAALGWDKKDIEIRQETRDKSNLLITHKNIAASYKALGKLDLARSHYQSALTIALETGNKQEQMDIYLSLGDLHREQLHEPQKSHKYYTEMLALAKDLGDKDKERQAYNRLGVACLDMQDNEAALEWHQKYLKMGQDDEDKTEQITAHKCIARSYKALGKPDQARSHFQSALDIAMETGDIQEQEDINKELASLKSCNIM